VVEGQTTTRANLWSTRGGAASCLATGLPLADADGWIARLFASLLA